MSNFQKKPKALSYIKQGLSVKRIARELDIEAVLVAEWKNEIPDLDIEQLTCESTIAETQIRTIEDIHNSDKVSLQPNIEQKLQDVAANLIDRIGQVKHMEDEEYAKALNLTADSIAKLQNAFINKGGGINIQNNNLAMAEDKVDTFKKLMKN
jgi:transposase-like protein